MLFRSTYDYSTDNNSPFRDNKNVKSLIVSEGITEIGTDLFRDTSEMKQTVLPDSLRTIKSSAFIESRFTSIKIPKNITALGSSVFWGSSISSLEIPENIKEIGKYLCYNCVSLSEAYVYGSVVGEFMFTSCSDLSKVVFTSNLKEIGTCAFTYCSKLNTIIFDGTLEQWNKVIKKDNWDANSGMELSQSGLSKINCRDGYFYYDKASATWIEVKE